MLPLFRANASELQLGKLPAVKPNTLIQISVLEPEPNDCMFDHRTGSGIVRATFRCREDLQAGRLERPVCRHCR